MAQGILEVRHFQMLRSIVDEGSVTAAAKRLHVSQPALSRSLADLERRLGLTLFLRGSRTMHPTPPCRRLLRTADQVVALVAAEEDRLRRVASGVSASLRLTTECYTCYRWLPAIIQHFRDDFPGVAIDIDTANASRPVDALREGILDLAIVYTVPDETPFTAVPLFEDELVVVMPPDHPMASKRTIRAEDFADDHLIVYSEAGSDVINQLLTPSGVRPNRVSEIRITDGILDLVKAGLGISVVAGWAAAADIESGRLVSRPIEGGIFVRRWCALAPADTLSLPHAARFVELLVENQSAFCSVN